MIYATIGGAFVLLIGLLYLAGRATGRARAAEERAKSDLKRRERFDEAMDSFDAAAAFGDSRRVSDAD